MRKHWQDVWTFIKRHFVVAIIITIVTAIYIITFLFLYNKDAMYDSFKDIITVYTCVTAVIGVIISGINVYISVTKYHRDMQVALFTRWYNFLIIDRNIDSVSKFFDFCENFVPTLNEIRTLRHSITGDEYDLKVNETISKPFTKSFVSAKQKLISDLSVFDFSLSQKVSSAFNDFQDSFFDEVMKNQDDNQKLIQIIRDSRLQVFKYLLSYNKDMMSGDNLKQWMNERKVKM